MLYKFRDTEYNINKLIYRMEYETIIHKYQEDVRSSLVIQDSGNTIFTKTDGIELSKGCQSCKKGTWWCLFAGLKCNTLCKFCRQNKDESYIESYSHPRSIATYWIDDVKFYIDKGGALLEGISYSGGEPFMYLDKIYEIARHTKENQGHIYQWVYTNGILVDKASLKKLKQAGISEIRVDLAATHFDYSILNKLKDIKEIIGKVTVEVPSIPEVFKKLVSEKVLDQLVELGVTQLNLAELELAREMNWQSFGINEDIVEYDIPSGILVGPIYSRILTYGIIKYAQESKLNILINDCSFGAKHLQKIMREMSLPTFMK